MTATTTPRTFDGMVLEALLEGEFSRRPTVTDIVEEMERRFFDGGRTCQGFAVKVAATLDRLRSDRFCARTGEMEVVAD